MLRLTGVGVFISIETDWGGVFVNVEADWVGSLLMLRTTGWGLC